MTWRQCGSAAFGSLVGLLAISAALPVSLLAATLTVTDCGDTVPGGAPGQLRRLITEAAPGDVIVIPACTIQVTGFSGDDANASGDLDITKGLTIRGAGAGRTILVGPTAAERTLDIFAPDTLVEISDMTITLGTATDSECRDVSLGAGGAIRSVALLTLVRVDIAGNLASSWGGGIVSGVGQTGIHRSGASLTIRDSTIRNNQADVGGGIASLNSLTLVNTTVSGNVAAVCTTTSGAAGIAAETLDATNVTIVGNIANAPPGRLASGGGTIRHSIIAGNKVDPLSLFASHCGHRPATGPAGPPSPIPMESGGHNISSDGTCGFLTGPGDMQNVDPRLEALAANGGATRTHALRLGSPAIDAGDDAVCPPADQRGLGRPADG